MPFGGATEKLQTLADTAEKVYERLNELRAELDETREAVDEASERLDALETEVADQRALVEAMARDAGVDVERVLAEAAIEEAEPTRGDDGGGSVTDTGAGTGD